MHTHIALTDIVEEASQPKWLILTGKRSPAGQGVLPVARNLPLKQSPLLWREERSCFHPVLMNVERLKQLPRTLGHCDHDLRPHQRVHQRVYRGKHNLADDADAG